MSFVWGQWWLFIILVEMALSILPVHHCHRSSLHECSLIVKKIVSREKKEKEKELT